MVSGPGGDAPALAGLRDRLTTTGAEVHGPLPPGRAAVAVAALVAGAGPGAVAIGAGEPDLAALGVPAAIAATGRRILRSDDPAWDASLPDAAVGLTGADLAVAETGTLVIAAGPGRPRLTHLLPPLHLCVLRVERVRATLAEALAEIASAPLPSAVQLVSGPSRTSDLEMRPVTGVHGPLRLGVVLVG